MPSFHDWPRGMTGQRDSPSRSGRTLCHTSTYGWPSTRTCAAYRLWAAACDDAVLLGAGQQVVHEHPHPSPGTGLELGDRPDQVVDAVEHLDDHALDPQVGAPDLLDQLGVVAALDEDPRPAGHLGPGALDGPRPGGRARGGGAGVGQLRAGRGGRRGEHHRRTVEQEARAHREALGAARAGPRGGRRACRRPSRRGPRRRTSRSRRPRRRGRSRPRPRGSARAGAPSSHRRGHRSHSGRTPTQGMPRGRLLGAGAPPRRARAGRRPGTT